MFKWKRLGQVFDPQTTGSPNWMDSYAQSPSAVLMDEKIRVYFCTRPKQENPGQFVSLIGYIDVEPNNPTKILSISSSPLLELGETGTFDEFGTNPVSVLKAPDGHLKMVYAGWTRCESVPINGAIGYAQAEDSKDNFKRLGTGPVIEYSLYEPFMMGSPRLKFFNGEYYLFYVAGKKWQESPSGKLEPIYKIRAARSNNGLSWTKFNLDLIADKLGPNECQACPDVIYANGEYHMFFSYRDYFNYKGSSNGYRLGYATSTDLKNWSRNDEKVNFQPSIKSDDWDNEMVSYPNILQIENRTLMFYQGNQMGLSGFGVCELEGNLC